MMKEKKEVVKKLIEALPKCQLMNWVIFSEE